MRKPILLLFATGLMIASCAAPQATATAPAEEKASSPQDLVLPAELLGSQYAASDAGVEVPNASVLEARQDGQAYLDATGRLDGWRIQFDRQGGSNGPLYVVNVVNSYASPEGAQLTLSRDWHTDVWMLIDSGVMVRLPDIPDLDAEQLVWQDSSGTVGVELVYDNLYILLTGPSDGSDQYAFFADLARKYLDWIKAGEP